MGDTQEHWQDECGVHTAPICRGMERNGAHRGARSTAGTSGEKSSRNWSRAQQGELSAKRTAECYRADTILTLLQLCRRDGKNMLNPVLLHHESFRLKLFCTAKIIFMKTKCLWNSFCLEKRQLTTVWISLTVNSPWPLPHPGCVEGGQHPPSCQLTPELCASELPWDVGR